MQLRFGRVTAVGAALGAVLAACATSVESPAEDGVADTDAGGARDASTRDGASTGIDACATVRCAAGTRCSFGACVADTTDADADGHDVRTDCNDRDPAVHPGAPEACNAVDDDCDGAIDEGFDKDGDGFFTCAHAGAAADCDDGSASVHPGVAEACNGVDDDCNGSVDEGYDRDGDGFFTCAHGPVAVDCDDAEPTIHPGAAEACNAKDDDCNGKADDKVAQPALNDAFQPAPNAHWAKAGSADINVTMAGWALLTPDSGGKIGALWWNAPYTFDHFDMTVTFLIDAKSSGADGLAFAWVPGTNVAAVGGGGAGYGFTGLGGGYGVAVDTYQNSGEPGVPFLAVVDGSNASQLTRAALPNVRDGKGHTLRVVLEAGKVSAWVDGAPYVMAFALPAYAPFVGHWGYTASTGSSSERHLVSAVSMTFPDGQGCVP